MTIEPKHSPWRTKSDHNITLSPFRKSNWKTGGARDYWEPHIGRFRQDVALDYTAEIVGDDDHPQDAAIIRITEDRLMEVANKFGSKGLSFAQLSVHGQGDSTIFMDFPNIIDIGGSNKQNFIIAQNEDDLEELSKIISAPELDVESYRHAAEYFGWPDCCIDFHEEHAIEDMVDPLYEIACNTPSAVPYEGDSEIAHIRNPDPLLNLTWRYNGWRFLQHLPCSFQCEHSSEIGRKNYDAMCATGHEEAAEYLLAWLDLPTTWSGYHACVNLRNAYGIGSYRTNNYWSEKQIIWHYPHQKKPDFEPNHNTTALEPLDPNASAL